MSKVKGVIKKEKRQIEIFPGTKSYITIFEAHKCCTGLLLSILENKLNTTISNYCTLLKNNILRTYLYTRLMSHPNILTNSCLPKTF